MVNMFVHDFGEKDNHEQQIKPYKIMTYLQFYNPTWILVNPSKPWISSL